MANKKILIAAATLCAVVVSQAASISWSSSSKLVDAAGSIVTSVPSGGSIVAIILSDNTGWSAGTWTAAKGSVTELGTSTIGQSKTAKGKVSGTNNSFSYGSGLLENGDVIAVVFKDSNGVYNQLVYQSDGLALTDTMTITGFNDNTYSGQFDFGGTKNFTAPSGGGDTPEPTSGLLLLLGVAGLALRRKQK